MFKLNVIVRAIDVDTEALTIQLKRVHFGAKIRAKLLRQRSSTSTQWDMKSDIVSKVIFISKGCTQ